MNRTASFVFSLCALLLFAPPTADAQATEEWRSWNRPVEPFRIAENLYYVGASDIASYLVTTSEGHILIDGGFVETAPLIEASIARLGFELTDVKILLNTHGHFDHAGGLAALKAKTGAKLHASAIEATLLQAGGKQDFRWGDEGAYPPVTVDRRLADGDTVTLGGTTLTARLTPGHTKGATTWTWKSGGLDVVLVSSASILDYRFVGEESYPGIRADFEKSFATFRALPCDLFLAPHTSFLDFEAKRARLGGSANPFVDPEGYRSWVERTDKGFREAVAKQSAEAAAAKPAAR
jgi:metallo-beta-lactamase class B